MFEWTHPLASCRSSILKQEGEFPRHPMVDIMVDHAISKKYLFGISVLQKAARCSIDVWIA